MIALEQAAAAPRRERVPDAVLGVTVLVVAEVMFFSGLVSAYVVLRSQAGAWPPPGQPRLPAAATLVNTLVLLASAWTLRRARPGLSDGWLGATLLLGAAFVALQGREWARLLAFGLTTRSSLYGGLFYTVIGAHAVHALAGLLALGLVLRRATAPGAEARLAAARVFWLFVVAVWPVLYALVYLW